MIVAGEAREYVPFGREYSLHHPGQFEIKAHNAAVLDSVDLGFPFLQEFKNISIVPTLTKDQWLLKKHTTTSGVSCDEELYVNENTVVWSRGSWDGVHTVIKTCTVDTPVIQVLWCKFILPTSGDAKSQRDDNVPGEEQEGICVVQSASISIFTEHGQYYSTALPFQVSKVWLIRHGLLFERLLTESHISGPKRDSPNHTTMFSMLHPLDEVAPVINKTSGSGGSSKINYMNDATQVTVFTSDDPSIVLMYDTMLGVHSIWSLRSPKPDEVYSATGFWDGNSFYHPSGAATPGQAVNQSSSNQSRFTSTLSSQSSSLSPLRSLSARVGSPAFTSHSSPGGALHTPLSHLNSPLSRLHSPSPRVNASPGNFYRTPGKSQQVSLIGNDSLLDWVEPLSPEVCLELLWTETAPAIRDGSLGKASKAFVMRDMCGQQYICYLVAFRNQLRCVKFVKSNDLSQLIFGLSSVIQAKDAQPVPSLALLLVLDIYGCIVLYSGVTKLNKLYIPGLPLSSTANASVSLLESVTPINLSPSGIVTSSRPSSANDARFDDEVQMISPVPTEMDDSQLDGSVGDDFPISHRGFILAIRDCVDNRFTLELLNGCLCQSYLPEICSSPGIDMCLKALKYVLPRDTAIAFLCQWYEARNAPGGLTNQSEWSLFYECLLSQMGYDTMRLALTSQVDRDASLSPMTSKRPRHTRPGTDADWDYVATCQHRSALRDLTDSLGLTPMSSVTKAKPCDVPCDINTTSLLFSHIPSIFFALHLVYEDLKLSAGLTDEVELICPLLFQLARDLQLDPFTDQYCRDIPRMFTVTQGISQIHEDPEKVCPQLCPKTIQRASEPQQRHRDEAVYIFTARATQTPIDDLGKMQYTAYLMKDPPNIHQWLHDSLLGRECHAVPYIPGVTIRIKNIISLYALLLNSDLTPEHAIDKCLSRIVQSGLRAPSIDVSLSKSFTVGANVSASQRVVLYMTQLGLTKDDLDMMPVGVAIPFREAIFHCRQNPPSDWPEKAYILIGRQDLSELMSSKSTASTTQMNNLPKHNTRTDKQEDDGMDHMDQGFVPVLIVQCGDMSLQFLRMRFARDLRVEDVKRFLQSSKPVRISLEQRPEVSDHDFVEEQEYCLLATSVRTMALPVGRGMFTLRTHRPLLTETLPVPKLCLTGRAPPRNTTVEMTHIDVPANMTAWPAFHNGVAAGLRICSSSKVDSAWILYNKPKTELTNEYGGFLMALGLNGHILNLQTLNIHDYLAKSHEMTSIGLILGLAAAKRGTMDMAMTRVLSIHLSALLPPTTTELNVAHNLQVAAILALGLVYEGTAHSHISEVLLSEIGRGPGPELENCMDRESYSLTAGLAFGLVMFGKGCTFTGMAHLGMADQLCQYMVGGYRNPQAGSRDCFRSPSYQVKICLASRHRSKEGEGQTINVDVTSPGATLALGMLFFNTNNSVVAEWLVYPDTQYMLNHIRPDFLLLRTLSKSLVMWASIQPSLDWIHSHIPPVVSRYAFQRNESENLDDSSDVDHETMSQGYCNIMTGACIALGLKFAGSSNEQAFTSLMTCMKKMLSISRQPQLCEQAGKNTVESAICVIVTSLAMVMAGSGNLDVLSVCWMLRKRIGPQYASVSYGSHLAVSMSIGLLFLGGGRYSLSTSPQSIGALICSFYPIYPKNSRDNRYHLQALRHLYILASEPRAILPTDVDSGFPCYVPVEITFKDTDSYKNCSYSTHAPLILPELDLLKQVRVCGPRYWPIVLDCDKNWNILRNLLQNSGMLYVKKRAGHLSYTEDPKGYRGLLTKSLTCDQSSHVSVKPEHIKCFTSDAKFLTFCDYFTNSDESTTCNLSQQLSNILYECISQEKPEAIHAHVFMAKTATSLINMPTTAALWQVKLISAYYGGIMTHGETQPKDSAASDMAGLIQPEFIYAAHCSIDRVLDSWQDCGHLTLVQHYLQGDCSPGDNSTLLAAYLLWYNIPATYLLTKLITSTHPLTLPTLALSLPCASFETLFKILATFRHCDQSS